MLLALRYVLTWIVSLGMTACSTASAPAEVSSPYAAELAPLHVTLASDTDAIPEPPAPPKARKMKLDCTAGTKVQGLVDRWSPLSTCPAGYQVTGLGRIDLQGDHNRPNLHVNDFICDDRGCKAWCIGDGCTVEARCCRISDSDQP